MPAAGSSLLLCPQKAVSVSFPSSSDSSIHLILLLLFLVPTFQSSSQVLALHGADSGASNRGCLRQLAYSLISLDERAWRFSSACQTAIVSLRESQYPGPGWWTNHRRSELSRGQTARPCVRAFRNVRNRCEWFRLRTAHLPDMLYARWEGLEDSRSVQSVEDFAFLPLLRVEIQSSGIARLRFQIRECVGILRFGRSAVCLDRVCPDRDSFSPLPSKQHRQNQVRSSSDPSPRYSPSRIPKETSIFKPILNPQPHHPPKHPNNPASKSPHAPHSQPPPSLPSSSPPTPRPQVAFDTLPQA
jgi:hypothetical protein